jgi:ribosomal protein L11 methyltransferase
MSAENVQKIIGRAVTEPEYRALLFSDPATALASYMLTDAQSSFLKRLSPEEFHTIVGGLVTHRVMPMRVGRRLVIVPAALTLTPAPNDLPIRLGPGWAFGNGAHVSTQLCLGVLEDYLHPGQSVLDLGTGSGILAIAAAKLGAAFVLALDIDVEAVQAARENTEINGVKHIVRVEQGSLDTMLQAMSDGQASAADVVVVNILAPVVVKLLKAGLAQALKPDGMLIVSGFVERQVEVVHAALQEAGLGIAYQGRSKNWVALIARRGSACPSLPGG